MQTDNGPMPSPDIPDDYYRAQLKAGRIMLQRSRSTGAVFFYPRICAPGTGTTDLEWIEASGLGTVYSTTTIRQRPEKGGDYNLALIDLDEGPRIMSRVEGIEPDRVRIGMRVKAHIAELPPHGDAILFSPVAEA